MTPSTIYLITVLIKSASFFYGLGSASIIISVLSAMLYFPLADMCAPSSANIAKKYSKIFFFTAIFCFIPNIFIPNENEWLKIYILPKVANSELIKELPGDIQQWLNLELERKELVNGRRLNYNE
jgi:hypothetical protein